MSCNVFKAQWNGFYTCIRQVNFDMFEWMVNIDQFSLVYLFGKIYRLTNEKGTHSVSYSSTLLKISQYAIPIRSNIACIKFNINLIRVSSLMIHIYKFWPIIPMEESRIQGEGACMCVMDSLEIMAINLLAHQ